MQNHFKNQFVLYFLTFLACEAGAQTLVTVPFLPDQFSVFNIYGSTTSNRTLNFMLPDPNLIALGPPDPFTADSTALYYTNTEVQNFAPYGLAGQSWGSLVLDENPYSVTCVFGPDEFGQVSGSAGVGMSLVADMFVMSQPSLTAEFANNLLPNYGSPNILYSAPQPVDFPMKIQGGMFDGQTIKLHGLWVYGAAPSPDNNDNSEEWDGDMMTALNWGIDPLGNTNYIFFKITLQAEAASQGFCLELSTVCSHFFSRDTVDAYFTPEWNTLINQVGDVGSMYVTGAIPEFLFLYDFSGADSTPPASTLPAGALDPTAVLAITNLFNLTGYTNVFSIINQYDAGLAYNLPRRFPDSALPSSQMPGGNACGPTSLRMMLYANGVENVDPRATFDNTTKHGLTNPDGSSTDGTANGYTWQGRALYWLQGRRSYGTNPFTAPDPWPNPETVWGREITGSSSTAAPLAATWGKIDNLLEQQQPVQTRVDLSSGKSPGGGHCILLLGEGASDDLKNLYAQMGTTISGKYYIVADPAGNFFADTNSSQHYGTSQNLSAKNTGINFAGWFAMYPKELMQARTRDTSATNAANYYRVEGLTFGSAFESPALKAVADCPVAITVTDPLGRQTGLLPDGTVIQNIPNSIFEQAAVDEEDEGTSYYDPDGPKIVEIDTPSDGLYMITLTGTNSGTYELDNLVWNSGNALVTTLTNLGATSTGAVSNYPVLVQLGGVPSLQVLHNSASLSLFWPTNAAGFNLQSSTNLGGSSGWSNISGPFFQTNGVYGVTNTFSGPRQFYRLKN